jgi:hypothetical protein
LSPSAGIALADQVKVKNPASHAKTRATLSIVRSEPTPQKNRSKRNDPEGTPFEFKVLE